MMTLLKFIWPGIIATQCLYVVAKLRIADLLASSPKTASELSELTDSDTTALERLLRAAITIGLFFRGCSGPLQQLTTK
jgi:hypothetical protein